MTTLDILLSGVALAEFLICIHLSVAAQGSRRKRDDQRRDGVTSGILQRTQIDDRRTDRRATATHHNRITERTP